MTKSTSTFDRMMKNPEWKDGFEKSYEEFLDSESMYNQIDTNKTELHLNGAGHDNQKSPLN